MAENVGTFGVYVVHEKTNYQYLPWGRKDIGIYTVETKYFSNMKEFMKYSAHFSESAIDEIVFFDEKEANFAALKWTLEKLSRVYNERKEDE